MRFERGSTRFVLLTGRRAVKFAQVFRPMYPLSLMTRELKTGGLDRLLNTVRAERNGGDSIARRVRLFFTLMIAPGLGANRLERSVYSSHPELPIAPVLATYFGGLILVMERGHPVSTSDTQLLQEIVAKVGRLQILEPKHVCRFGHALKLVDYGNPHDVARLLELSPPDRGSEEHRRLDACLATMMSAAADRTNTSPRLAARSAQAHWQAL
jgi:hypothetical protein